MIENSHSTDTISTTLPIESCLNDENVPEITILPEILTKKSNNFRCLFGRFHVYGVSKCLLLYHTLLLTFLILLFFRESAELLIPMFVLFGFTAWGLYRANADWLLPFVVYSAFSTIMFILFSAYFVFYSVLKDQKTMEDIVMSTMLNNNTSSSNIHFLPIILHVLNILICSFHCWQVLVLMETRKFLQRIQISKKERIFQSDTLSIQTMTVDEREE